MHDFLHSKKFKIILIVVLLLFCGMFISAATYGSETAGSSLIGIIVSPFQKAANAISSGVSSFFDGFKSAESYQQQIEALEDEISSLKGQLVDYEKTKQENQQYEEYLDIKEQNPDFEFISAEVIASDPADLFSTITISKGTLDGVSVDDPVIKGDYLVGVVAQVGATSSVVNTILNPKVNVSAYEIRTKASGSVSGDIKLSEEGLCKMGYLHRDTGILPESTIVSSGVGGIFPRGLIVGNVTEVKDSEYDISAYAVVKPGVDISNVKDVFVITSFQGQGSSDANED